MTAEEAGHPPNGGATVQFAKQVRVRPREIGTAKLVRFPVAVSKAQRLIYEKNRALLALGARQIRPTFSRERPSGLFGSTPATLELVKASGLYLKEPLRRMYRQAFLQDVLRDLRYGVRALCRAPGFTTISAGSPAAHTFSVKSVRDLFR